ncbi:MAG TPA: ATP-dependent DNA helicase [Polyangiaceae bacterium]|nr:ATP-dependent DNA helicase [Polyangiaceae bacterium]
MSRASDLLGPEGPLAKALQNYEPRSGQLDMASAVERALAQDQTLLCEAGTGTGKTLAYLVPALLSGKRVVVSTATRALQDQIVSKDVPLLERALGRSVRSVVLKGLGNTLCLRRYAAFRASEESLRPNVALKLGAIESWRQETDTGDFAELIGIPESDPIFDAIRSSSETRLGGKCPHYDECLVTRVRQRAENAELVITNHHLFFADLALRGPHPGRILPNYDAVIFDEAHQLEDVATLFFGLRVSVRGLKSLLNECARFGALGYAFDHGLLGAVEHSMTGFFEPLAALTTAQEPRVRLEPEAFAGQLHERYLALDDTLLALEGALGLSEESERPDRDLALEPVREALARRTRAQRDSLTTIVEGGTGRVTWFEREQASGVLSSAAVDVSHTLRERLFNTVPALVLTSATLTTSHGSESTASPFAFTRARLGIDQCDAVVEELVVPSPFDFKRNSLLYAPKHLPAPNDPAFLEAAAVEIEALVAASDGGAFVLSTSNRMMQLLHRRLQHALGERPVLLQGQAPKPALLSAFRQSGRAVLVATLSFWEGVDVPGSALRLVVLEKVPFSVPSDPVLQARAQALEEAGQNPFNELFLPLAQMTLKQGFGRLIRTQHDRGVVALFDSRIHSRGYGARLLSQLPPARRCIDLDSARKFLRDAPREP